MFQSDFLGSKIMSCKSSPSLTLSKQGSLAGLVLGDLVRGVLLALFTLAVGIPRLWDVDLESRWFRDGEERKDGWFQVPKIDR